MYVNLEHPYVSSLIEIFSLVCPRVNFLESTNVNWKTTKDEMFEKRKTIEQLMRAEWLNKSKVNLLGLLL